MSIACYPSYAPEGGNARARPLRVSAGRHKKGPLSGCTRLVFDFHPGIVDVPRYRAPPWSVISVPPPWMRCQSRGSRSRTTSPG